MPIRPTQPPSRGGLRALPIDRHSQRLASACEGAPVGDFILGLVCSGGAMIKITAAERPKFMLGQFIVLGIAMCVALVELAIWLSN